MKKILLATAYAAALIATTVPAAAQSAGEQSDNNSHEFDEIIVTAERRRTDLQKTPIAATVMTGDKVVNSGVTVVDQLQFISPAAVVNNFGQGIDFNIRGIGKAEHNTQTTTGVITYRDGVATFPGYYTAEPYYDIARVEILRGPQGTFVGQNATGGAVFVASNDPIINGEYTGYFQGSVADHNGFGAQGAINCRSAIPSRCASRPTARSATATTTSKVPTPATTACSWPADVSACSGSRATTSR